MQVIGIRITILLLSLMKVPFVVYLCFTRLYRSRCCWCVHIWWL